MDNVLSHSHVDWLRTQVLQRRDLGLPSSNGVTIADFLGMPEFAFLHALHRNPLLLSLLHELFGGPDFRFCSHNDIGIDRAVTWHKDKLNNEYAHFQTSPLWPHEPGQGHFIVKVAIYLQDHTADSNALKLVPRSHMDPCIRDVGARALHPRKGSVVIFEQRITHRGQPLSSREGRVLISLGYGRRNKWTDEFELGTRERQKDNAMCQMRVRQWLRKHEGRKANGTTGAALYSTRAMQRMWADTVRTERRR